MSDWIPTTCMRCAVGCGHLQRSADVGAGIDTIRGDASHPVSQGLACARGIEESANPDGEWLTTPLVRDDGELQATTWDVALSRAVAGLREARSAGPDEVAILGSGQQTNEAAYLLGKVARGGFGTRTYDANTTLCMASAVTAYYEAFGSDAPPCTYADIDDARERLSEAFLVAQDAFHTETTELADVVLPAATWGESSGTRTWNARFRGSGRRPRLPAASARTCG